MREKMGTGISMSEAIQISPMMSIHVKERGSPHSNEFILRIFASITNNVTAKNTEIIRT